MDISMYHCAQELATDLHSMIDRNVRDLYTIAFKNNAPLRIRGSAGITCFKNTQKNLRTSP